MYKNSNCGKMVIRISDGAFIPKEEGNSDYESYFKWVSVGNKIKSADKQKRAVPSEILRAQGKTILILEGLWQKVNSISASIEDPVERELFEVAIYEFPAWKREGEVARKIKEALGLTDAQVDALFIAASSIEY